MKNQKKFLWLDSADDVTVPNCYKILQRLLSFLCLSHGRLIGNRSMNGGSPLALF